MIIDVTNGDASGVAYWKAERFLVKWTTNASEIIFELAKGPQEAYMYNSSVESSLRTASNSYLIENLNELKVES